MLSLWGFVPCSSTQGVTQLLFRFCFFYLQPFAAFTVVLSVCMMHGAYHPLAFHPIPPRIHRGPSVRWNRG